MALSTDQPIMRAIKVRVRDVPAVKAALKGGVHTAVAPKVEKFPYAILTKVAARFIDDWGSGAAGEAGRREIHALYDLNVFAKDEEGAETLLEQLDGLFSGPDAPEALAVEGQNVMLVRSRGKSPMGPTPDEETNERIAIAGVTIEIWTDQPIPYPAP